MINLVYLLHTLFDRNQPFASNHSHVQGKMADINPFCSSSYLAFRFTVTEDESWQPGAAPSFPKLEIADQIGEIEIFRN